MMMGQGFARAVAPCAGAIVLAILLGLFWSGRPDAYDGMLRAFGVLPHATPFLDTGGAMAAWECARLGIDVIDANPCDVLGRSYNYSPFWMSIAFIPLGNADRVAVGLALDALFLLSLALLAPPRRWRDVVMTVAATISTMVVFALDRGNPDTMFFLLTFAVVWLIRRGAIARWTAYAVIWFMMAIKYYPVALLILALRETPARLLAVAATTAVLAGGFIWYYYTDMFRQLALLPEGSYDSVFFGMKNFPMYISRGVMDLLQPSSAALPVASAVALVLQIGLILVVWRIVRALLTGGTYRTALETLSEWSYLLLIGGSALLSFCFFLGHNIGYRGIFLLFVLPALLAMANGTTDPSLARLFRRSAMAIVFVMWGEAIRHWIELLALPTWADFMVRNLFWLARELSWWWIITLMVAALLDFMARSTTVRALSGWAQRTT